MIFRNPWIDPRVQNVQPAAARTYLLHRGWKALGPAQNPDLLLFGAPSTAETRPTVLVPLRMEQAPHVQRMIDLITELALFEKRYAGAVLDDLLQSPSNDQGNGSQPGEAQDASLPDSP